MTIKFSEDKDSFDKGFAAGQKKHCHVTPCPDEDYCPECSEIYVQGIKDGRAAALEEVVTRYSCQRQ